MGERWVGRRGGSAEKSRLFREEKPGWREEKKERGMFIPSDAQVRLELGPHGGNLLLKLGNLPHEIAREKVDRH